MELHDEEFLETEQALIERIRNFGQDDFADALENAIEFGGLDRRKRAGETTEAYEEFLRDCPWACFSSEIGILFKLPMDQIPRHLKQREKIMNVFTHFLGSNYFPKGKDSMRIWRKDNLHSKYITGGGKRGVGNILYSTKEEKRFFRIMMLYASAGHRPTWQRILEYLYEHPWSSGPDISEGVGLGRTTFRTMIRLATGPLSNMLKGENPILIEEDRQGISESYQYNLQDEFREVYEDFYSWVSSEEGIEIYKDWLELYHNTASR
jgi:hypothetical protein